MLPLIWGRGPYFAISVTTAQDFLKENTLEKF